MKVLTVINDSASEVCEEFCSDFDEDCDAIAAEGGAEHCYAYDPDKGKCPFIDALKAEKAPH